MKKHQPLIYVVVPTLNGGNDLKYAVRSLIGQSQPCKIVLVDNASTDGSIDGLDSAAEEIQVLRSEKNLGFAGGVNRGIRFALENGADFVALFNNDAVADENWLSSLCGAMADDSVGIVAPKILSYDKSYFDSTGDFYTCWGMPFPRGRGEPASQKYDDSTQIFAASGAASLYRSKVFKQIGLFDEDFFAYFEDVDISFRAQLAGWRVVYQPKAVVRHKISATSSKLGGFGTFQSFKNLPLLFIKNVPLGLMPGIGIRFFVFYWTSFFACLFKDSPLMVLKGSLWALMLTPKKLYQRIGIQRNKRVSNNYMRSIIIYDLPPESKKLRKLRKTFTGS